MATFYPLLTLVSIALFGWLGWRMAKSRYRNGLVWAIGGAVVPPALLVLLLLRSRAAEEADEDKGAGELNEA
jgi:hypothetical protein